MLNNKIIPQDYYNIAVSKFDSQVAWTNIQKAVIDEFEYECEYEYKMTNNTDVNLNEIGTRYLKFKCIGNLCKVNMNHAVKYELAKLAEWRFEICELPIQYRYSLAPANVSPSHAIILC